MLLTSQHLKVQTINKECQGTSFNQNVYMS